MSSEEIKRLSSDEVQEYIFEHAFEDEKKLLLKHKTILGLPAAFIAHQIAARKKAELKLPFFYKTKGIVYPPSLNLEQSSSEATAKFKSEVVRNEIGQERLMAADLTGGFGIDSFFLSQIAESLDYVESNTELFEIFRQNCRLLKRTINSYNQTAEDFLKKPAGHYDFVFIDPSRRDSSARKVFSLRDCAPDVTELLPALFQQTNNVLLKASPLLDIKLGGKELSGVKKVIVVSVNNECKELLFFIQKKFTDEPLVQAFNLDQHGSVKHKFDFKFSREETSSSQFSAPKKFLYEPNASILKAGAFKIIGETFRLDKIHFNTHLYTSDKLEKNFPGRIFEIEELGFDVRSLAEKKANIITRNYPLTVEELKKKLKLKDGGDNYVIAFTGQEKKYVVLAKRLA